MTIAHSPFQPPWNFLGLPERLTLPERARAWLLPIGYEATTSYGAGTRDGPAAIIAASRQVELYDRELDCEAALDYGVHTMPELHRQHRSPEMMMRAIERVVADIVGGTPAPALLGVLGGEHSISAGVARGVAKAAGDRNLVAVQIDAHADLRDEYEGCPWSHACAARRILDVCPVFQIGIRNISAEEEQFRRSARNVRTVFSDQLGDGAYLRDLAKFVRGKRVFLTVDLDGLDPSIMPAVGTPEPDGLSWNAMMEIVRVIARNAAGMPVFDVVELAPIPGLRGPDFIAARLVYRIMSLALLGARRR